MGNIPVNFVKKKKKKDCMKRTALTWPEFVSQHLRNLVASVQRVLRMNRQNPIL